MSESLTELLRGFLLALPYLVAIDYDVVVVGYPANPNGAKGKVVELHDLISFLPVIRKDHSGLAIRSQLV